MAREGATGHQSLGMLRQSGQKVDHRVAQMGLTGASDEVPRVLMGRMLGR